MTHLVIKTIALTALSIALTACGSGKDSSAKTTQPEVDNRAVGITEDNLETVLATAFAVTTQSGPGTSDPNRPEFMAGNLGDGLLNVSDAHQESTSTVDSATGVKFQVDKVICTSSGNVVGEVGFDTAILGSNGVTDSIKIYTDFTFDDCKTNQFWMDGKARISLSSQSGILTGNYDSTLLLKLTAELNRFYVALPYNKKKYGIDADVTGKVEFSLSNPERKYIRAELNGAAGSSLTYKIKGRDAQVVQLNEFESYIQSSMVDASYTIGVKGSMVNLGKPNANSKSLPISMMKIYVEKPIVGQGFAVPYEGVLVVETDKEIAKFIIVNQQELRGTLDKGKDGTIDSQYDTTWEDFIEKYTSFDLDMPN